MPPSTILMAMLAAVVILLFLTLITRYKRCPSNRILVIYGKTGSGASKCVHGGAAFVLPLLQDFEYLDLEPFVVPIDLDNALSQENIRVSVPTTVTAAISNQPGIMENAAIRLLGLSRDRIESQAQDIILGQMRAVIATMQIEEINRDRQAFMAKVNDAVSAELEKIGLAVINVNIKDIDDESGYIKAIGKKAAAEAINQALVDVAEQEKTGKAGVAQRERDQRTAVAAAGSEAEIGEAEAARNKRQSVAALDAQAVEAEATAEAKKAGYLAEQTVAEQVARQKGQEAAKAADGAIRVAQERAEKEAEEARALREEARLKAEIVVPAEADKERQVVQAEAEKAQQILVAEGEASAIVARRQAEAKGTQAILGAKAEGYKEMVVACGGNDQAAAAFLIIERLTEVAHIQAEAIQNLPLEKVMVWDGGNGEGGLANLGQRMMGAIPPMHDLARLAGLELPEFLGRMMGESPEAEGASDPAAGSEEAAEDKEGEKTQ